MSDATTATASARNAHVPNPADPPLECDLVMKGGITSGVVYPAAVMELHKFYRFRSIGGASAGAIAAAFTAAAEYGREAGEARGPGEHSCGFQGLQAVRAEILDEEKQTLRNLFRSDGPTAPLLDLLIEATTHKALSRRLIMRAGAIFGSFVFDGATKGAAFGLVIGVLAALALALLYGFAWLGVITITLLATAVGAVVGAVVQPVRRVVWILKDHLPADGCFGLCRGFIPGDKRVLTTWLHDRIERLAGNADRTGPLTFAQLAGKGEGKGSIQLRMMTSNLSHRQPYVFPHPLKTFIFRKADFDTLFPKDVVTYLTQYWANRPVEDEVQGQPSRRAIVLAEGFHFLPPGDDLPVIVATRMSLSFPLLLSAVPLYTIDRRHFAAYREGAIKEFGREHLHLNWISDGGISSNFPIHFFDSFLPSRPTFGMNLVYLGADDEPDDGELKPPQEAARRPINPTWKRIANLKDLLGAIFGTAKDYRDNMQMMLPSYRERTAQIRLRPDEGGLNLAMPPETVAKIDAKGTAAGAGLLPANFDLRHHQWVRLQVLMAALERQARGMRRTFSTRGHFASLLAEQERSDPSWYKRRPAGWVAEAQPRLDVLVGFLDAWNAADPKFAQEDLDGCPGFFCEDPPKPIGVLRVTPNV